MAFNKEGSYEDVELKDFMSSPVDKDHVKEWTYWVNKGKQAEAGKSDAVSVGELIRCDNSL